MYEENFNIALALILFLAMVKLLQLLKFNRRLSMIMETIGSAQKEVIGFTVIFLIVYSAFCSVFFLLLSSKLVTFSNYLLVNEEAFAAMLGKFSFDDIVNASWLAPWFFFVFMIMQAMILINMLVTIVTNYFVEVRCDASRQGGDAELMDMFFSRMKRFVGMNVPVTATRNLVDKRYDMATIDSFDRRADLLAKKINKRLGGYLNLRELHREARQLTRKERAEDRVRRQEIQLAMDHGNKSLFTSGTPRSPRTPRQSEKSPRRSKSNKR